MLLEGNNLMTAKADKGTTMVTIHKVTLKQEIDAFIPENQIIHSNKDPTESFQKHIQQTMHKCNTIINKSNKNFGANKTHGTKTQCLDQKTQIRQTHQTSNK